MVSRHRDDRSGGRTILFSYSENKFLKLTWIADLGVIGAFVRRSPRGKRVPVSRTCSGPGRSEKFNERSHCDECQNAKREIYHTIFFSRPDASE